MSAKQKQAMKEIKELQKRSDAEWLHVWASVRPLLTPKNIQELRVINEELIPRPR